MALRIFDKLQPVFFYDDDMKFENYLQSVMNQKYERYIEHTSARAD